MKKYVIFIMLIVSVAAKAQCTFRNTAFSSGEYLTYNLYFNWKFVWVKAGTASMYTVSSTRDGKKAFRCSLTTRGNERADKMYLMRDTLLCYVGHDMAPIYYRKGAKESKRYTVDEVFYSYPGGKCQVKQHRLHSKGDHTWQTHTYPDCVYDMLSIFLRARSFDPANWTKGYVVNFPMVDGDSRDKAKLQYKGKITVKADNGKKYRCLELSFQQLEKGKYREIVRFFVTDDDNHIPIRLDLNLKFGAAKAFLVSMKGNRNPMESEVK